MSLTRQQAGQKIVDALIPAEVAIDQAFASCATLAAILPDARISAAISAEIANRSSHAAADWYRQWLTFGVRLSPFMPT